jgi:crooked neck
MEETLGNIGGCRAIFERWMEWEPEDQYWLTYINFELRLVHGSETLGANFKMMSCT